MQNGMMIKMRMLFMIMMITLMDFLQIMMLLNQSLKGLTLINILKNISLLLPIMKKLIIANLIL